MRNLRVFGQRRIDLGVCCEPSERDGHFLLLGGGVDGFVSSKARDGGWQVEQVDARGRACFTLPDGQPVGMGIFDETDAIVVGLSSGVIVEIDLTSGSVEEVGELGTSLLNLEMSPDQELVVLISETSTVLMTKDWDCLKQWPSPPPKPGAKKPGRGSVAWRADGKFFVVNYGGGDCKIYERTGEDHSTLDLAPLAGEDSLELGATCGWQPRVGGMVSVPDNSNMIRLFERNGLRLRRTDFSSRKDVVDVIGFMETLWNASADLLAVVTPDDIRIFHRKNYHWYLKHQIDVPTGVLAWTWSTDAPLSAALYTSDRKLLIYDFEWTTTLADSAESSVAVVDGTELMVTQLARSMSPPPMCHKKLHFEAAIVDVSFAKSLEPKQPDKDDELIVILANGKMFSSLITDPLHRCESLPCEIRLPLLWRSSGLYHWAFVYSSANNVDGLVRGPSDADPVYLEKRVTWQDISSEGIIYLSHQNNEISSTAINEINGHKSFGNCGLTGPAAVVHGRILESDFLVLMTTKGSILLVDCLNGVCSVECDRVTSCDGAGGFVMVTTKDHKLVTFETKTEDGTLRLDRVDERNIDRGSLIVASLRDDSRVVLQAPRGNLETVVPRPVISKLINGYVEEKRFGIAFDLCRQHRVNMNIIANHKTLDIVADSPLFVDQVTSPAKLSLFISSLDDHILASGHVDQLCNNFISLLTSKGIEAYNQPIITAHLQKSEVNYEAILTLVLALDGEHREGALDYLLMLVPDSEQVYQAALGTYDLRLAAMVAGQCQMDPAEYAPQLKALHQLDENTRKFRIDDQLARSSSAFKWLCASDSNDKKEYAIKHNLFREALLEFGSSPEDKLHIGTAYGKYRLEQGDFREAGAIFADCVNWGEAASAYLEALDWPSASLAARRFFGHNSVELENFHDKLANAFLNASRPIEAAEIRRTLLGQVTEGLEILLGGQEWKAAIEMCSRSEQESKSLDEVAGPVAAETAEEIISDMREAGRKIGERRQRLHIVRENKLKLAQSIEARERDLGPDRDSEVFTNSDASSQWDGSQFSGNSSLASDFTMASTRTSLTTIISDKAAERRQAKLEAKRSKRARNAKMRIHPGHPKEEEYLVESLRKLGPRKDWLDATGGLLQILVLVGKTQTARELQLEITACLEAMYSLPDDISGPYRSDSEGVVWRMGVLM